MRKSFHAVCRLGVPVRVQDLTEEQEKIRSATAVRHKGEWCAVVPHEFETDDATLFDQHMADVHGKKPSSIKGEAETLVKAIRRMWNGPRLTEDGKPFEPKDLEPGATVTWRELVGTGVFRTERRYDYETKRDIPFEVEEREPVERTGQVWSGSPYPKSAWVIPFEKRDGELAVLVRQEAHTGALRHSQTWTVDGYRDAA